MPLSKISWQVTKKREEKPDRTHFKLILIWTNVILPNNAKINSIFKKSIKTTSKTGPSVAIADTCVHGFHIWKPQATCPYIHLVKNISSLLGTYFLETGY